VPHTSAYRRIKWLVDEKLLVIDKVLITDEVKKYGLFHSILRSMIVKYENYKFLIDAEQSIEPINGLKEILLSLRR